MIAWSPSRILDFIKCPLMFWFKYVDPRKLFPWDKTHQTEAQKEGDRQHEAFEKRIRNGVPFPAEYAHYEPIAQAILRAPGHNLCEVELTLNADMKPCGWFDKTAYVRARVDLLKINGACAFAGDYKSGTPRFDEFQLKLTAAMLMNAYPDLQQVTTAYIWLKTGMIDPKVYHRADLAQMWDDLMKEPLRLQEASVLNHWPAKPNKRNCAYCVVNKKHLCGEAEGAYRGD